MDEDELYENEILDTKINYQNNLRRRANSNVITDADNKNVYESNTGFIFGKIYEAATQLNEYAVALTPKVMTYDSSMEDIYDCVYVASANIEAWITDFLMKYGVVVSVETTQNLKVAANIAGNAKFRMYGEITEDGLEGDELYNGEKIHYYVNCAAQIMKQTLFEQTNIRPEFYLK